MHGLPSGPRTALLAVAFTLSAAVGTAQTPAGVDAIEIYHGTRKVAPRAKPPADPTAGPKAVAAVAATFEDATRSAFQSTGSVLNKLLDRSLPKWDAPRLPVVVNVTIPQPPPAPTVSTVQPIFVAGGIQPMAGVASGSSPPRLLPWAYSHASHDLAPQRPEPREEPKPNVIIIREAAAVVEPRPEPNGVRISSEVVLLAFALFGTAGVVTAGVLLWRPWVRPSAASVPLNHVAVRGLDAGELPKAEAFDVGPTYAEERADARAAEQAGESAMLRHVLDQNLALRAAFAAEPAAPTPGA